MKGDPLETLKKFAKKSLTKPKKTCTKNFWSWAGLEPVLLLGRPQKILQKIRSRKSYISVAVSGSQLIKLIKSVTSLVLKKQAGNGPSRRQIKGSKIAKGLRSVKVFSSKAPQKPKSWTGLARQGNALTFFIPSVANHHKN